MTIKGKPSEGLAKSHDDFGINCCLLGRRDLDFRVRFSQGINLALLLVLSTLLSLFLQLPLVPLMFFLSLLSGQLSPILGSDNWGPFATFVSTLLDVTQILVCFTEPRKGFFGGDVRWLSSGVTRATRGI